MLFPFIIIKIKSKEDILSGVSKLDNLVKVSVFQSYKKRKIELLSSFATSEDRQSVGGTSDLSNNLRIKNVSLLSADYVEMMQDSDD